MDRLPGRGRHVARHGLRRHRTRHRQHRGSVTRYFEGRLRRPDRDRRARGPVHLDRIPARPDPHQPHASPRRGRVLAAKAVVIGAVAFLTGLVSSTGALLLGLGSRVTTVAPRPRWRPRCGSSSVPPPCSPPAPSSRSRGRDPEAQRGCRRGGRRADRAALILAVSAVLPAVPAQWVLRLTPAAGFAVQQALVAYPQVNGAYTPAFGTFRSRRGVGSRCCAAGGAGARGGAYLLVGGTCEGLRGGCARGVDEAAHCRRAGLASCCPRPS